MLQPFQAIGNFLRSSNDGILSKMHANQNGDCPVSEILVRMLIYRNQKLKNLKLLLSLDAAQRNSVWHMYFKRSSSFIVNYSSIIYVHQREIIY